MLYSSYLLRTKIRLIIHLTKGIFLGGGTFSDKIGGKTFFLERSKVIQVKLEVKQQKLYFFLKVGGSFFTRIQWGGFFAEKIGGITLQRAKRPLSDKQGVFLTQFFVFFSFFSLRFILDVLKYQIEQESFYKLHFQGGKMIFESDLSLYPHEFSITKLKYIWYLYKSFEYPIPFRTLLVSYTYVQSGYTCILCCKYKGH